MAQEIIKSKNNIDSIMWNNWKPGYYQQGGNLVYQSFGKSKSVFEEQTPEEEIDFNDDELSFPVEPVRVLDLSGFNNEYKKRTEEIVRGTTQFKTDGIDVGNMRDLLDKFEEAGISVRVTSGNENRKTKQGKKSKHSIGDAIDITPIAGETYQDLADKIRRTPGLIEWMRDNQIGIIDETDPLMKMRTGATGNHWHISKGNESLALYGFEKLFS